MVGGKTFSRFQLIGAAAVLAVVLGALALSQTFPELSGRAGGEAPPSAIAMGQSIYAEHCASCHGADLEGEPDWKQRLSSGRLPAPPHDETGHTWHHSDRVLFEIAKYGPAAVIGDGYESNMPAFEGVLTDEETRAVLAFIKSSWPEREREFQDRVTRQEQKTEQ